VKARRSTWPLLPMAAALLSAALLKGFVADLALVEGRSMLPTLREGQVVVVLRAASGARAPFLRDGPRIGWAVPRPGDLVVARSPESGASVIKRVVWTRRAADGRGRETTYVFLVGDNPAESMDSRTYGALPVEEIAGKVLLFRKRP
jgi:signal peptidase I